MMPSCIWGNCHKTAECKVRVTLPNSVDNWWRTPNDVYLCEKHYKKLLNKLNIIEVKE